MELDENVQARNTAPEAVPSSVDPTPAVGSAAPPPIDEQKRIIKELISASDAGLVVGASYYLLSTSWWRRWKSYVGYDDIPSNVTPGPIDNSALVETVDGDTVVKKVCSSKASFAASIPLH